MIQKLYHGKNKFLSLRAIHNIIDKESVNYEIVQIDADISEADKIIDLIYSPSLFFNNKIYFIKRLYRNKEKDTLINTILEILSQDSFPILIWEDQKIRSNTKYYKFFKSNNNIEEFDLLNKRSFISWAKNELSNYQLQFQPFTTLQLLARRSNYEPERFINNLEKIKLLQERNITEEVLDHVVADTLETDIWKLMDNINQFNRQEINKTLEKLLEYRTDPNYILAMIARNLRISIQIKHLINQKINDKKMASILKLPPFAIYPIIKAVKDISHDKILLQYKKLCNLDYEIKTGRIDPTLGLSLFTLML